MFESAITIRLAPETSRYTQNIGKTKKPEGKNTKELMEKNGGETGRGGGGESNRLMCGGRRET